MTLFCCIISGKVECGNKATHKINDKFPICASHALDYYRPKTDTKIIQTVKE